MAGEQHDERERTYTVPADVQVPFVTDDDPAVAGVDELELEAVYHDTAGLDLLARGVTLRRRTGGSDEGWHLKVPRGPDHKTESRHPLGPRDAGVPEELLAPVRAVVRDRPLVPVAVLRTRRRETRLVDETGAPLATVCDDRVRATVPPGHGRSRSWREWELELADGSPPETLDLLEQRLVAVGARPSEQPSKLGRALDHPGAHQVVADLLDPATAGGVLQRRLAALVAELHEQDAAVRAGAPEGVHRMRIAARRIRSALTTGRPLLVADATDDLRAELRWLGEVLGRARDPQVVGERLVAAARREPAELLLGPVLARIDTELHRQHAEGIAFVREALGSARYFRLLDGLDELVGHPPVTGDGDEDADQVLGRLLRAESKRVRKAVRAVGELAPQQQDEALHEVRKKAKRLRYAAELAIPVGGKGADRLRRRAKAVQQALGDHQDSVVARARLRELGAGAHLHGENGFTFGLLLGTERLHALESRSRAEAAWSRLPAPRTAQRWVRRSGGGS